MAHDIEKNKPFNAGWADNTDHLANNQGQVIKLYHIPTKRHVWFKAFITTFTDQYTSEWNSEEVYGRMDPIQTFKGTKRTISLGWDVPASSFEEARDNLKRASLLVSMLYPTYEKAGGGASTIVSPPFFKLKFMNLIQNANNPGTPLGTAKESGLLGTIGGFTYEPDLESGFFQPIDNFEGPLRPGQKGYDFRHKLVHTDDLNKLFPQTIKFQCEFTVLHQHELGFTPDGKDAEGGFNKFPYTKPKDLGVTKKPAPVPPQTDQNTKNKTKQDKEAAAKENKITK